MVKHQKSQWEIDPKVYVKTIFQTEYTNKIGEAAPSMVYKRVPPPEKNKSNSLNDGGTIFPSSETFKSNYTRDFLRNGTAGTEGYEKRKPFAVKKAQVEIGSGRNMEFSSPYSHDLHPEVNMRLANVRNTRRDGLRTAGIPNTIIPNYNIIPGVGGEKVDKFVFDAYQDTTNKFRDTRRFAKMNNPVIPRGHVLNLLTGDVQAKPQAPHVEVNPRDPRRPPLNSLGQVRPVV